MNRGAGLRYAAHAKSGQINLFKEEKKKTKKFSYKKKTQPFPVRKVQTQSDAQPTSNTTQSSTRKPTTTKSQPTTAKTRHATATEQRNKPAQKNFIKKNAQSASGKVKQDAAPAAGGGGGSTVTLTQDQLNSILATIGKAAGSGSAVPNISLENGNIKVEPAEEQAHNDVAPQPKKSHQSPVKNAPETNNNNVAKSSGGEDVLAILTKGQNAHGESTSIPSPISPRASFSANVSKTPAANEQPKVNQSGSDVNKKAGSRNDGHLPQVNRSGGFGDVSSIIGLNQRELAEKKKQQWKKELDEQIALKKQQQGGTNRRGRGRDDDSQQQTWDPWGQPQNQRVGSRALNASMNLDLSGVQSTDQNGNLAGSSRDPFSSRITPRDNVTSSLGKIATQKYTPAAMRSSFIIGGDTMDNHIKSVKEKEKREWLQELERQKREDKARKDEEKRKQQDFHDRMEKQWAEQVSPRSKSVAHTQQMVKPVTTVDDSVISQTPSKTVEVSPNRHHSADAVPNKGARTDNAPEGNNSHGRAFGLLVDPVEADRKEIQRQKHQEHMLAVKAQVEERQRQKREAMEAKKREEAEEERKLAEERDMMQKQFELEKEKQRKKEEEKAAKMKALMDTVQAAHDQAQQEKHKKRVQKLAQQGHDVNNLRKSWEAKHISPETSPRYQPVQHSPPTARHSPPTIRHSPVRLEPIVTHAPTSTTNSPRQDSTNVVHIVVETQDAVTSPTFDQAVQTDFQFPPDDVLLERAYDIQREASAGVEYKPEKQNKKKTDKQHKAKSEETKTQEKGKKTAKSKSLDVSEEEAKPKRTTSVKNRPVWGQGSKSKKKLGNTQKDLTGNAKKREERRKKRMEEMLALQEQSAPKRLLEKKKASSLPQSRTASVSRAESTHTRQGNVASRAATEIDVPLKPEQPPVNAWTENRREERREESRGESRRVGPAPSPPIHSGDFVPFLRNDVELIERSIPVSPNSRQSRARETPKSDKGRSSSVDKKDPLLNPERLKDSNLRQEKILEQLSNLRQGLMMKQRELEMGLSSTPLVM